MIEKLFKKNYKRQVIYVTRAIQRKCDAEDIVQSAYLKACEDFHKFDPTRGKIEGWFWLILCKTLSNYWKTFKLDPNTNFLWETLEELIPSGLMNDNHSSLMTMINTVSNEKHRYALFHYYILGSSHEEVEAYTGISAPTFRKMVNRLTPKFKTMLE